MQINYRGENIVPHEHMKEWMEQGAVSMQVMGFAKGLILMHMFGACPAIVSQGLWMHCTPSLSHKHRGNGSLPFVNIL